MSHSKQILKWHRDILLVYLGSTKKRILFTESNGIESQSNKFPELKSFKMAVEELFECLLYICCLKMDTKHEQSYHQSKTQIFAHDNKNKCQNKRNHSPTRVLLTASIILFQNHCRLFQISSGRDGRASESSRCPIESMGIALPILAPLPLAQTNQGPLDHFLSFFFF